MWMVDNRTPFAAERGWVRDRDGAEIWLVAVKATFDILPDSRTEIAKVQPEVLRLPEHHGEPGKSSIKYDADLILTKTTTDVIVVGHAYAPHGRAVRQLDIGLRIGSVKKMLRVFGDRQWGVVGASHPQPFVRMPLIYERSYGGTDLQSPTPEKDWDWRNPVGTGFLVEGAHAVGMALPNIEHPGELISSWNDRPDPAGFGVVASHWQPRASLAGSYDDHWMKTRQPLLAEDMDDRYFQSAPVDQQLPDFLHGGEPVSLLNLTPTTFPNGVLHFMLPKVNLSFVTRFYDGSSEIHRNCKLHSVIVEPGFPRVSLVWHSALPCHFKMQKLEKTIVSLEIDPSARGGCADQDQLAPAEA